MRQAPFFVCCVSAHEFFPVHYEPQMAALSEQRISLMCGYAEKQFASLDSFERCGGAHLAAGSGRLQMGGRDMSSDRRRACRKFVFYSEHRRILHEREHRRCGEYWQVSGPECRGGAAVIHRQYGCVCKTGFKHVGYFLSEERQFHTQAASAAPARGPTMNIHSWHRACPPWNTAGAMLRAGLTEVPV